MDNIKEKDIPEEVILSMIDIYGEKYHKAIKMLRRSGIISRWNNIKECVLSQGHRVNLSCNHEECIEYITFYNHRYTYVDLDPEVIESVAANYIHYKYFLVNGGMIDDYTLIELAKEAISQKDLEVICKMKNKIIEVLREEITILNAPGVDAEEAIEVDIKVINSVHELCNVGNNYDGYKRLMLKKGGDSITLPIEIILDLLEISTKINDMELLGGASERFIEMLEILIDIENDKDRYISLLDNIYSTCYVDPVHGLNDDIPDEKHERINYLA